MRLAMEALVMVVMEVMVVVKMVMMLVDLPMFSQGLWQLSSITVILKSFQGYRPTAHYWQERTFWRIVSAAFSLGPRSELAKPSLDYAVCFVYLKVWQIISLAKSLPKLLPWRADSCSNILTLDWSQCPDIWSGDILTFCAHIYWHSSVSDILTPGGRRLKLAVCRGKFLGADFGEGGGGGLVAVWGLLIKTCQGLLKPT